ncbi:MAG: hypothetical protein JWP59_2138 [Massilia sp.]|jgi:hypothetical protein|nr:hypothetical protein [Massilia sp.]
MAGSSDRLFFARRPTMASVSIKRSPMPIKPEQLAALMHEVEQEDPIDFADLPFDEHELRELVASHLCEMAAAMDNFSTEDRLMTLLAVSAKLVLENLVLHLQLLRRHGLPVGDSVEALLSRLRQRGA